MFDDMNILAFVPARGGSKGVPRKNLKRLADKPLIGYTLESLMESTLVDRVVVSTEDNEIADVVRSYNPDYIPFMRPAERAQDTSRLEDSLEYTLRELKEREGFVPDILVTLFVTFPFRRHGLVDDAIKLFVREKGSFLSCNGLLNELPDKWMSYDGSSVRRLYDINFEILGHVPSLNFLYASNALNIQRLEMTNVDDFVGGWLRMDLNRIESLDIDEEIDFLMAESILEKGMWNDK